jgi:hypothetical protein
VCHNGNLRARKNIIIGRTKVGLFGSDCRLEHLAEKSYVLENNPVAIIFS